MLSDLGARNEREDRQNKMSHAYVPEHGALEIKKSPLDSLPPNQWSDECFKRSYLIVWPLGESVNLNNLKVIPKATLFRVGYEYMHPILGKVRIICFCGKDNKIVKMFVKTTDLNKDLTVCKGNPISFSGLDSASDALEWTYANQARNLGADPPAPGFLDTKFSIYTLSGSILAGAAVGLVIGNILGKRAKK